MLSRDEIASCAEEKFPFEVNCALLDAKQNVIYLAPTTGLSLFVYKILDTTPSLLQLKEIHHDDDDDEEGKEKESSSIVQLTVSPNQLFVVGLLSNQSIRLYSNGETLRFITELKKESRSTISDVRYWDDQVCSLSLSFSLCVD